MTTNNNKDNNNNIISLNSLLDIKQTLKNAYEKDPKGSNVWISFDLKKHLIKQDKTNKIIVKTDINNQEYNFIYKDFDLFKQDLAQLKEIEKTLEPDFRKITNECDNSRNYLLIKNNFSKQKITHFNKGFEGVLYKNFVSWYNTKKEFVLNDKNKELFNKKHLEVKIKSKIETDSGLLDTRNNKYDEVYESIAYMIWLQTETLTVSLALNNNITLIYKLDLANEKFYDKARRLILADEETIINYYNNLIKEFYDKINDSLSNKKLDFLFQVAKYNQTTKYEKANQGYANYKVLINNKQNNYLILGQDITVYKNKLFSSSSLEQVAKNVIPFIFNYDLQTKAMIDDGASFVIFKDIDEIIYEDKSIAINNLKYAHKSLSEWMIWYEKINEHNTNFKNLKEALKSFNDFKNDKIIDLKDIRWFDNTENRLEVYIKPTKETMELIKENKWFFKNASKNRNINWFEWDDNLLLISFNYENNSQLQKDYLQVLDILNTKEEKEKTNKK